jgi:hypothetical protein
MSAPRDNPYLQHLAPSQRGVGLVANGAAGAAAKEPLYGFLPRKVTSEQVSKAMVHILHYIIATYSTDTSIHLRTGTRHEPVYKTTAFRSIQEDLGRTEETACVCADDRILQDGE